MLCVPFTRGNRILTEQMQMAELMIAGCVEFDQTVVWCFHIGIEESAAASASEDVADVGERSEKLCAHLKLFLIGGFHILRAPAEVPNRRGQFPGRRALDLIEEQPRLLRPHRAMAEKPRFLTIKFTGVELDGSRGVRGVQMQMMKVCRLRRGLLPRSDYPGRSRAEGTQRQHAYHECQS